MRNKCEKICSKCKKQLKGFRFYSPNNNNGVLCAKCAYDECALTDNFALGYFGKLEERITYSLVQCDYFNSKLEFGVNEFNEENIEKVRKMLDNLEFIKSMIELFDDFLDEEDNVPLDVASYHQIKNELLELLCKVDKTSIIKSNNIYSPQNYLLSVTGKCFGFLIDIPILNQILKILEREKCDTENYQLSETVTALKSGKNFVLVDCTDVDENSKMIPEYRWFCVPDNFKEITE